MKSKHFVAKVFTCFSVLFCLFLIACKASVNSQEKYYTITYQTEHGTAPQNKSVPSGYVLTAGDLPTLQADGYTFKGWYIGFLKIEAGDPVESDMALRANWTENPPAPQPGSFTITYATHGVSCEVPASKTVPCRTELTYEDLPDLSDEDHEFNGWYFGSTQILPGYKVYTNMTLTAYWDDDEPEEVKYTVSYRDDKFGYEPLLREITAGETLSGGDLLVVPEDGYEFAGWYFGDIKMESGYPVMQDMVLVAKWYYTITYSTDHGTAPQSAQVLAGTALTTEHLPVLTCNGYTFTNWSMGSQEINVGYVITDNMNLTANWIRPNLAFLISAASNATLGESNFELSTVKSGSDYIITAPSGFDIYLWSVDDINELSFFYYVDELNQAYNTGNIAQVITQNTLTFNEQNLPAVVTADGTYRVFCQALKINYDSNGDPESLERAGLDFVVIKM